MFRYVLTQLVCKGLVISPISPIEIADRRANNRQYRVGQHASPCERRHDVPALPGAGPERTGNCLASIIQRRGRDEASIGVNFHSEKDGRRFALPIGPWPPPPPCALV